MRNILIILVVLVLFGGAIYNNERKADEAISQEKGERQAGTTSQNTVKKSDGVKSQEIAVKPVIGHRAPSFTLPSLDGKKFTAGGKREKPIVINFWASWCGPCQEEAPDLERLYTRYKDQIDFYAVNVTVQDDLDQVKMFVDTYKMTMPILLDHDPKKLVANKYQLVAFPTTFILDRNGMVAHKLIGQIEPASFEEVLKNVIKSK
ncbi:TlpA family protein disulfide reductase [Brevibacillus daliensis]|uniref:TlpA family protein disulfide reductase n=1 Tax=Brevibacillus daliensis TaxID=2892995 RepID=UPI001E531AD5|nr:TlpA disulfide reductase family protein [Brevibacillus daliensis]